eukprot:Colp12_sorted_trinity150504_noHs@25955
MSVASPQPSTRFSLVMGTMSMEVTRSLWPVSSCSSAPLRASQMRTTLSSAAVHTRGRLLCHTSATTLPPCRQVQRAVPVMVSHTFMYLSMPPEATHLNSPLAKPTHSTPSTASCLSSPSLSYSLSKSPPPPSSSISSPSRTVARAACSRCALRTAEASAAAALAVSSSRRAEWMKVCSLRFPLSWYRCTVPSADPDKTKSESAPPLARQVTSASCASVTAKTWRHWPDLGIHWRTVPSSPPVTMLLPSRVKSPHVTAPSCPANTCTHWPLCVSHIHTVPSLEPAMTALPLLCQCAHSMSSGPSRVCTSSPVSTCQIFTRPSYAPAHVLCVDT